MKNDILLLLKNKKISTAIFAVGIIGILLIFMSGYLGSDKNKETNKTDFSEDEYCSKIENKIKNIVTSMTGNENVQVIVTLDSSYEYVYLNEKDLSNDYTNDGEESTKKKDNSKEKYIIVEDSNGNENGLIVTTLAPTIRGVVIIYDGNSSLNEGIKSAVMAVLNISKNKIYVSSANPAW